MHTAANSSMGVRAEWAIWQVLTLEVGGAWKAHSLGGGGAIRCPVLNGGTITVWMALN